MLNKFSIETYISLLSDFGKTSLKPLDNKPPMVSNKIKWFKMVRQSISKSQTRRKLTIEPLIQ